MKINPGKCHSIIIDVDVPEHFTLNIDNITRNQ